MSSPADAVIALYETHADAWTRVRGRHFIEAAWLDRFMAHLPAGPARVLDVGCGSGEPMARYLIDHGKSVVGVDAAPSLISRCKAAFPEHAWHLGDMRHMALGQRFDGILAWNSFFHLTPEDQRLMFPIFRDHAASHGLLMFTSGPALGEAIGSFEGEALYHGSLDAAEYETLLEQHGFEVLAHVVEDPTCGQQTVWLAQRRD